MEKLLMCLLLLFSLHSALSAPQDNEYEDPEYDLHYSEPTVPPEDCVCVPFYQCSGGEIVDDGSNLIDPRNKPQEDDLVTEVVDLGLDIRYSSPECGRFRVCCRYAEESTVRPYEHRCGTRNPGGILSEQATGVTDFGEWPWQVAILEKKGTELFFKCGGTLIDNRHIITVAHCADKLQDNMASIVVRLGEWDTQNKNEFLPPEDYDVSDIIIHSQYRSNNLHNDIAILKVNRDVVFRPHIDTACLPRDEDDFTGQECIVTGWGSNAYKSGVFPMIMKEVTVPVLGHNECQEMLRKTRLGSHFKLDGSFLCAGGKEGEDSCKGDGGGPLVCFRSDNTYTVAGLVSWGLECKHSNIPGVYVNVKKFIDWIASKAGKTKEEYWGSQ